MAVKHNGGREERVHPLAWIFYTILLPLIFTIVMIGVALQVFGYNVTGALRGYASTLPVVGRLVAAAPAATRALRQPVDPWKTAAERDARALRVVRAQLAGLRGEVSRLGAQAGQYSKELAAARAQVQTFQAHRVKAAQEGQVLANMSSSQAALILMQQPTATQVLILQAMSTSDQAALLAALPPKTAAALLQAGG